MSVDSLSPVTRGMPRVGFDRSVFAPLYDARRKAMRQASTPRGRIISFRGGGAYIPSQPGLTVGIGRGGDWVASTFSDNGTVHAQASNGPRIVDVLSSASSHGIPAGSAVAAGITPRMIDSKGVQPCAPKTEFDF